MRTTIRTITLLYRSRLIRTVVLLLLLALALSPPAAAQLPQTPIQATVTDPNGTPYAFGTGSATLRCPGNQQASYNGSPILQMTITITGLDGYGKFSMQLWNLAVIQPATCAWTFAITAQDGKTSFTTGQITTVTGNTLVDLSSAISAYAVPLPISSLSQFLGMANMWTAPQTFSKQITSTLPTGTAPFSIASTTVVPNLNAQLHNGLTAPASAIVGISDSQNLTNKTVESQRQLFFWGAHSAERHRLVAWSEVNTSVGKL